MTFPALGQPSMLPLCALQAEEDMAKAKSDMDKASAGYEEAMAKAAKSESEAETLRAALSGETADSAGKLAALKTELEEAKSAAAR